MTLAELEHKRQAYMDIMVRRGFSPAFVAWSARGMDAINADDVLKVAERKLAGDEEQAPGDPRAADGFPLPTGEGTRDLYKKVLRSRSSELWAEKGPIDLERIKTFLHQSQNMAQLIPEGLALSQTIEVVLACRWCGGATPCDKRTCYEAWFEDGPAAVQSAIDHGCVKALDPRFVPPETAKNFRQ